MFGMAVRKTLRNDKGRYREAWDRKNENDMKKSFRTNAKCGGCVAKIAERLNEIVPSEAWSIDLTSADRLLTVETDLPDEKIVRAVTEAGFRAEPLG